MRDGTIIDERYLSRSMAKSVISILVGTALDNGMIASFTDPIDRYMPETSSIAYIELSGSSG